jgi:hypothetical protein
MASASSRQSQSIYLFASSRERGRSFELMNQSTLSWSSTCQESSKKCPVMSGRGALRKFAKDMRRLGLGVHSMRYPTTETRVKRWRREDSGSRKGRAALTSARQDPTPRKNFANSFAANFSILLLAIRSEMSEKGASPSSLKTSSSIVSSSSSRSSRWSWSTPSPTVLFQALKRRRAFPSPRLVLERLSL